PSAGRARHRRPALRGHRRRGRRRGPRRPRPGARPVPGRTGGGPLVRRAARPAHRARHRLRGGRLLLHGDRRGRRRRVGRRPRRGPARHEPGRTLMSTLDVIVATIGRAHGLRGEVALTLRTVQPEERLRSADVFAVRVAGRERGTVTGIDHYPAQDLLIVRTPDRRRVQLPLVEELVPEVDLEAGVVLADPPGGLFDALDEDAQGPDPETSALPRTER